MTGPTVIDVRADPEPDLGTVAEHVRSGGVLAYPTETVYGLGGACTPQAVEAVRAIKGRDPGKPMIALVPSAEAAADLEWTAAARELAAIFWPGSVTLVLADPRGRFPPGVRSESGTVAVRVSPHPVAARLLEALGAPITSTSLNVSGEPPVSTGAAARELLRELGGDAVVLLDAGALPSSPPSTVIDCTGPVPRVLREGAVPVERIRCAIPEVHAYER